MPSYPHAQAYAELKGLLAQQGLFDRQPRYYTWKILQMLSGLGLALGILLTTQLFWLQMLNAAFLACVFTQVAFLGHDAGHRQMFQSSWKTDVFWLLCTLLTAISYSWWTEEHNRHHRYPNHLEWDPDVQLRFLAHPVTDFWFGGLNYQIEHHLFPSMARNQLKAAQATVQAFCQAPVIPSHETRVWQGLSSHLTPSPPRQRAIAAGG